MYEFEKKKLTESFMLNKIKFSLTPDLWKSFQGDSFISLTIHYVDDSFNRKMFNLETFLSTLSIISKTLWKF
jgi:hypothetical protein